MTRFILPWVAQATQTFVHADDVREAVSLALVSGKHLILFGPGGHAKSEMITSMTRALAGAITFVQSFGEGMDEARLADLVAQKVAELQRNQAAAGRSRLTVSD